MRNRKLAIGAVVSALALGLAACGSDDDDSGGGSSTGASAEEVTVYSSLPLQGASRPQTTAMVQGIKLALQQQGGKAGNTKVNYKSLDDSTASEGSWEAGQVSANARKAAQDDKAVVYIGEFNSGASAISIPLLNEGGVPQISPANTAVGLTTDEPGADKGEPEKYYPTGKRTYARIVPKDTIQGAALATVMKQDGCKSIFILNDKEVYGAGLAKNIENSAKEQGIAVEGNDPIEKTAANYRSLVSKINADCVVYSGITANNAVQLYKDLSAGLPNAKLYGPDGVAESGFADPKEKGIPASVGKKIKVSVATLDPDEYGPEGKAFFADFQKEYGERNPDPYAIYGYEAMKLALQSIENAGDDAGNRERVLEEIFKTKDRDSVLGTYSIDEDGDTTLTDYGIYKIEGGELVFDEKIQAAPTE
ncbi:MAG: branched-chain amino acid ABC transporter substrate-binding protein [Thermoleophilaceae bacterium]|nr:branched-chain amino acid ABC transporter substrate-binding protein [Thermoleophilaceae bacterium]